MLTNILFGEYRTTRRKYISYKSRIYYVERRKWNTSIFSVAPFRQKYVSTYFEKILCNSLLQLNFFSENYHWGIWPLLLCFWTCITQFRAHCLEIRKVFIAGIIPSYRYPFSGDISFFQDLRSHSPLRGGEWDSTEKGWMCWRVACLRILEKEVYDLERY